MSGHDLFQQESKTNISSRKHDFNSTSSDDAVSINRLLRHSLTLAQKKKRKRNKTLNCEFDRWKTSRNSLFMRDAGAREGAGDIIVPIFDGGEKQAEMQQISFRISRLSYCRLPKGLTRFFANFNPSVGTIWNSFP